jgi:hypothetical protein
MAYQSRSISLLDRDGRLKHYGIALHGRVPRRSSPPPPAGSDSKSSRTTPQGSPSPTTRRPQDSGTSTGGRTRTSSTSACSPRRSTTRQRSSPWTERGWLACGSSRSSTSNAQRGWKTSSRLAMRVAISSARSRRSSSDARLRLRLLTGPVARRKPKARRHAGPGLRRVGGVRGHLGGPRHPRRRRQHRPLPRGGLRGVLAAPLRPRRRPGRIWWSSTARPGRARSAGRGTVRRRRPRSLRMRRRPRGRADPHAIRLVRDHRHVRALGAGLVVRRHLEDQLDHAAVARA